MTLAQEMMYWAGSLIFLIGLVAAFLKGITTSQKQEDKEWWQQFKEQIETIGSQSQRVTE